MTPACKAFYLFFFMVAFPPVKKGATSVRFSEKQHAILKRIAEACDVKDVDVARWAVEALGAYWSAHGGRLLLPLDFTQRFSVHSERMILEEPPVEPRSNRAGGGNKTNTRRPKAIAPG
jgi:hypothetical protein